MSRLPADPGSIEVSVCKVTPDARTATHDHLAIEEPLEIRLAFGPRSARTTAPISVTMRTPGSDFELAAGFLFGEGIVTHGEQIEQVTTTALRRMDRRARTTSFEIELAPDNVPCRAAQSAFLYDVVVRRLRQRLARGLEDSCATPLDDGFVVAPEIIPTLPPKLRASQDLFERTGGIHAAGLFDSSDSSRGASGRRGAPQMLSIK